MSKTENKTNSTAKKGSGVLTGLLFLVIGIAVLWSNEGRTVKTQKAINYAKKNYIDVSSAKINSANDGKIVATKGKMSIEEATVPSDPVFGISIKSAKLVRNVEMYQWKETCETDNNDKKNCTYEKVWEDDLIDSTEFEKSGYTNPSDMPYENETVIAENVKLGEYILPEELIDSLKCNRKVGADILAKDYQNTVDGVKAVDRYLTTQKGEEPEIGDIRVSFEYLTEENVSVMAVQNGNTFEAYTSREGKDIYKIVKGNKTGAQILEMMTKNNKTLKWGLRILGIFLVVSGISTMFTFINTLANKVPVLGKIVSGATGLISGVLGVAISLVVIAIAWFRFRPLLSICLLVVVAGLIFLIKYLKDKNPKEETKVEEKKE